MLRATESASLGWLSDLGLPTPRWVTAGPSDEVDPSRIPIGPPWIVKPDVAIGGKGNLGLVRKCNSFQELRDAISTLLTTDVGGFRPSAVVIEEYIEGEELYLSISIDETARRPVLRVSADGGIGFDAVRGAAAMELSLLDCGLPNVTDFLITAGIHDDFLQCILVDVIAVLWRAFIVSEAVLLEVNPLRWDGHRASAVGVALEFDDHATLQSKGTRPTLDVSLAAALGRRPTPRELLVATTNAQDPRGPAMRFLELDGDIAFLATGGGASLICFDFLHDRGIKPGCYTDFSPGGTASKLSVLFQAGLTLPKVRGVLITTAILSLMDTTTYVDAILDAIEVTRIDPTSVPFVVRVPGPSEDQSLQRLRSVAGIVALGREYTLEDACQIFVDSLESIDMRLGDTGDF